eukprot:SAG31_NODE_45547_length_258_cov_0.962264_1_plen_39_part_01
MVQAQALRSILHKYDIDMTDKQFVTTCAKLGVSSLGMIP